MSKTIDAPAACEIRSVIRFLTAKCYRPREIHRQICEVYGQHAMSEGMVARWVRQFNEGRDNVHDDDRPGRPSLINVDLLEKIETKIRENRRFTISDLAVEFPDVSRTVLYRTVTEDLHYRKLCARWVPKMLTLDHKQQRMASALEFLTRYEKEGETFLRRIVTGDETWVRLSTPESKQQSMQWRRVGSPRVKKFKLTPSTKKFMCTVFWDWRGILLVDFMDHGATINAAGYCETLRKLRRAIQNKRRGLLSKGVLLLHDNARPHTAHLTQQLLDSFGWEVVAHPPYSPDLAPSDYHLFLELKKFLAGQRFESEVELQTSTANWLHSQAAQFYEEGMQKLVPRYDKCLNVQGDYVEK